MMAYTKTVQPTTKDPRVILHKDEFKNLGLEDRRYLMSYWREYYPTTDIIQAMGYNNSTTFYKMVRGLGLPTNLRKLQRERLEDDNAIPNVSYTTSQPQYSESKIAENVVEDLTDDEEEIEIKEKQTITRKAKINIEIVGELALEDIERAVEFCSATGLQFKMKG